MEKYFRLYQKMGGQDYGCEMMVELVHEQQQRTEQLDIEKGGRFIQN